MLGRYSGHNMSTRHNEFMLGLRNSILGNDNKVAGFIRTFSIRETLQDKDDFDGVDLIYNVIMDKDDKALKAFIWTFIFSIWAYSGGMREDGSFFRRVPNENVHRTVNSNIRYWSEVFENNLFKSLSGDRAELFHELKDYATSVMDIVEKRERFHKIANQIRGRTPRSVPVAMLRIAMALALFVALALLISTAVLSLATSLIIPSFIILAVIFACPIAMLALDFSRWPNAAISSKITSLSENILDSFNEHHNNSQNDCSSSEARPQRQLCLLSRTKSQEKHDVITSPTKHNKIHI